MVDPRGPLLGGRGVPGAWDGGGAAGRWVARRGDGPEADSEAKWKERQDMAGQIRGDGDVFVIPLLRGE
jgi:hypothetical protein